MGVSAPTSNEIIRGTGLWSSQGQAEQVVKYIQRRLGIANISVKQIDEYIDTPWREILGADYDNWRRGKWLGKEGDVIRSQYYPEIMEAIESRYPLGPRAHRRGLEEISPFLEGPLSWVDYLTDLEGRDAFFVNLTDFPPQRVETPEVVQASDGEGWWLEKQLAKRYQVRGNNATCSGWETLCPGRAESWI